MGATFDVIHVVMS